MQPQTRSFKDNASQALKNENLQSALAQMKVGFIERRRAAADDMPEFEALRDQARDLKNHALANLDFYLERYEEKAVENGASVHWAATSAEARKIILDICKDVGAKTVTKGKSMISEEIALNDAIEAAGLTVIETDLGEYIVQLRKEPPSHIIAPAVHVLREEVEDAFRKEHTHLDDARRLTEPSDLLNEARQVLRQKYMEADVGITGANFLIAETGSSVIVTNEGNGDLTQTLAKTHIVITSLEKVVPTMEDASSILRVLARSATGQDFTAYTTFSTGPKRPGDPDGPENYHVIILDNGRSDLLGGDFQEALRCIRCGACMNHCPVYHAVGGHSYGWVYPGPIGSVLTPTFLGVEEAGHLPNASTFCGRCESVCPVRIPLPKLMRNYRVQEFERGLAPPSVRAGLDIWGFFARKPALYRFAARIGSMALRMMGRGKGRTSRLPLASGWTDHRDMPIPTGPTFQAQWSARGGRRKPSAASPSAAKPARGSE